MSAGRLVLVATSPRTPPGLLSWPAWEALRSGPVLVGDGHHPQLPYLRDAGIDPSVEPLSAADLHARAAAGADVVWLSSPGDDDLARRLGTLTLTSPVTLEVVFGSYDLPGARLLDVVAVMDRLRSPGGCPWDARQTHDSLKPYLLEEAYEAYEAIEDGSRADLREELGDVLLQIAFHARLAQEHEQDAFSIDDVAGDLVDKLVRRHPHVFAGAPADDVEATWEQLKTAEKGRTSVTEGVPLGQPALSLATKLQKRGSRIGAPVPAYDGLGGELWDLVVRCRAEGLYPEAELRAVARSYRDRLAELERESPDGLTAEEWASRWS
ncbi:MAG: MazG family protein [Actinobacteria bacterium]|nr:MazG family protein [Actinomycetota bacterium]MCA1721717.1 MazG family protein [Actinomycetota bacterium]